MPELNLNSALSVLEVSGPDAANYLQGQLTNDIHELTHQSFQLSSHLNPKGRMLAAFIITKSANNYYLISDKQVIDKILPRLKMFILRSKVQINLYNTNITLTNYIAKEAFFSLEISPQSYLTLGTKTENLNSTPNLWHKYLVEHTIPMIYLESIEKLIPQQVNYDLIGGINFKKGCYTGQEIVARTHYLGKSKRRLVKFSTPHQPHIGQTIVSPLLDNQEVGFIVDFYYDNELYIGLASLQTDCLTSAFLDNDNLYQLNCNII